MNQNQARFMAKRISEDSELVVVADTIRQTESGSYVRGGWPHPDQTWAVFLYRHNTVLFPLELRGIDALSPPMDEVLRMTERDIAANPGAYGTTGEEWERVRQWPGEFHPKPGSSKSQR